MEIQAFTIFIDHWLKEENQVKKQTFKNNLKAKQFEAFSKMIHHKQTIADFRLIFELIEEMDPDSENFDWEEFNQLKEIGIHLTCKIFDHHYIYGVCDLCHSGLVTFRIEENGMDLSAICRNCDRYHCYVQNLFAY